jgi:putative oxidoreductase
MRDWGLPERWAPWLLSVLRIVAGLIFLEHGAQKLLGFPPPMPGMPPIAAFTQFWYGGILELFGGLLVLIGLLTRPAAFILAGEMAVAYWMFHAPKSPFPAINGGDAAILFCFVFLYLSAAGPGPWSLDAAFGRRRR